MEKIRVIEIEALKKEVAINLEVLRVGVYNMEQLVKTVNNYLAQKGFNSKIHFSNEDLLTIEVGEYEAYTTAKNGTTYVFSQYDYIYKIVPD